MSEAVSSSVQETPGNAEIEAAIGACVRNFYAKGRKDEIPGRPVFDAAVSDWEDHLNRIENSLVLR